MPEANALTPVQQAAVDLWAIYVAAHRNLQLITVKPGPYGENPDVLHVMIKPQFPFYRTPEMAVGVGFQGFEVVGECGIGGDGMPKVVADSGIPAP